MPDDAGDRTEAPTPRRRSQARREGRIPRSRDLSAAVLLLGGLILLQLMGGRIWGMLLRVVRAGLAGDRLLSGDGLSAFSAGIALEAGKAIWPFLLGLMVAAVGIMYLQVGWLITGKKLKPDLMHLNPLSGLKNLFSMKKLVDLVMNIAKLTVVGAVAWLTIAGHAAEIVHAMQMGCVALYMRLMEMLFQLGLRLTAVMLVLALFDYAYQRYRHERDLKMTKQEVKDELKNMDGDPKIRQRRRRVQMELAMQRLRAAVAKADVVITNPEHLAIALEYDAERMNAPVVVAKGSDYAALRIRQLAAAAGVPIVERRALTRAMYDVVRVGQEIPERFYQAIAEILAYVYELTGKGLGPRAVSAA